MTELRKAGSVIIKNLGMFDEASRLLDELQGEVFNQVDEIVEDWANEKGWVGKYDFINNKTWVAHTDWLAGKEDGHWASLSLGCTKGHDDSHWLTHLCGECQADFGVKFMPNYNLFGKMRKWNEFYREFVENEELYKSLELKKVGFNDIGQGVWFLPIKLDKEKLASEYEQENYIEVKDAILNALEAFENVSSIFTGLIEAGKEGCI